MKTSSAETAPPVTRQSNPGEHAPWLASTPFINCGHPHVAGVAAGLAADGARQEVLAVRIHDYVRDHVEFGWTRSFYDMTASDVLTARVGYCNTKTTLLIALLRAVGIPARQHFVNIRADLLSPYLNLPQDYVDHSYAEVLIHGRWIGVDSYVPDPKLFARAKDLLERRGLKLGYGVHHQGSNTWDARSPSFAQYVRDGDVEDLSTRDYGLYEDTASFYAERHRSESLSGVQRFLIPMFIAGADAKVQALRDGGA